MAIKTDLNQISQPGDNLRKEDKSFAPKVSFIQRFHCIAKKGLIDYLGLHYE